MIASNTCPTCGKPLPTDAPMGICPDCLLSAGFGTVTADAEKLRAFQPPPAEELAAHFPQLEILTLLGRGGMGAVYKARQKRLDRVVALKILPPGIGEGAAFAERFEREAKALAKLHHPHIVTLYEFGQAETGAQPIYYFLMEFVDGVTLRQLLHGERISPQEALAIVPQICDALQFAHDRGIVHRDIKPENILLNKDGQVKIADFGVAKLVAAVCDRRDSDEESLRRSRTAATADLTEAGKIMGTPSYMAPEQIAHPGDVDHRADIYALGVVFYQMLTGELPAKRIEPPSAKVQIDVRLDEIVLRALEKKPELRYQQASVLKTQVENFSAASEKSETRSQQPEVEANFVAQFFPGMPPRFHRIMAGVLFVGAGVIFIESLFVVFGVSSEGSIITLSACVFMVFLGWLELRRARAKESGQKSKAASQPQVDEPRFSRTFVHSFGEYRDGSFHFFWGKIAWFYFSGAGLSLLFAFALAVLMQRHDLATTRSLLWALFIPLPATTILLLSTRRKTSGNGPASVVSPWIFRPWSLIAMAVFAVIAVSLIRFTSWGDWEWACFIVVASACFCLLALKPRSRNFRRTMVSIGAAIGAILLLRAFVIAPYRTPTEAVSPEIPVGSRLFVFKLTRHFFQGDIVAYQEENNSPVMLGRVTEPGPIDGRLLIERRRAASGEMAHLAIQARTIVGKVVFNTRGDFFGANGHAAAAGFSFGPVIEREVKGAIDFDSGKLAALPESVTRKDNITEAVTEAATWMEKEGMDAMADSRMHLFGVGMHAASQDVGQWERLTVPELMILVDLMVRRDLERSSIRQLPEPLDKEATYVFQTREGGKGILQILGSTDNGVKIRYKLVQSANSETRDDTAKPNESAAMQAANSWLALMDSGAYAESWKQAAESFHKALTQQQWITDSEKTRKPLGKVLWRNTMSAEPLGSLAEMPDGSYFEAQFESSYGGMKSAMESIRLALEKDGRWRVIGYFIRPLDENAKAALVSAQKWLDGIDRGNYAQSWKEASASFQSALTEQAWTTGATNVRKPLGDLISRKIFSGRETKSMPGLPDGDYEVIQFDTSFSEKKSAVETVTFELEKDGAWRAAGYYIK